MCERTRGTTFPSKDLAREPVRGPFFILARGEGTGSIVPDVLPPRDATSLPVSARFGKASKVLDLGCLRFEPHSWHPPPPQLRPQTRDRKYDEHTAKYPQQPPGNLRTGDPRPPAEGQTTNKCSALGFHTASSMSKTVGMSRKHPETSQMVSDCNDGTVAKAATSL